MSLSAQQLTVADAATLSGPAAFPYVPGYLSFRESHFLVRAFAELSPPPDLVFMDGHGFSHPRRLGLACHFGLLVDRPTIGVAKTILVGAPAGPLGSEPGDTVPLVWEEREIGAVLRTRRNANPIYISVGHRISLRSAVDQVLAATRGLRLPEPIRQAHLEANRLRRSKMAKAGEQDIGRAAGG